MSGSLSELGPKIQTRRQGQDQNRQVTSGKTDNWTQFEFVLTCDSTIYMQCISVMIA